MIVDLSSFEFNCDLIVEVVPQLNLLLVKFKVSIILFKHSLVSTLLKILVSVLIVLKVNIDLCKFIPELLLAGTHAPVASIEYHYVFELTIHQVHDDIVIVLGLCQCLRQCQELSESHPLAPLVLYHPLIRLFENSKEMRLRLQLILDVHLRCYECLNRIKFL